jgi:hypothetical protein
MSSCKELNWCIERSMQYARKYDFKQAVASFCSDLTKNPCTKMISDHPMFLIIMLSSNFTSVTEFETHIRGFAHSCICKNK